MDGEAEKSDDTIWFFLKQTTSTECPFTYLEEGIMSSGKSIIQPSQQDVWQKVISTQSTGMKSVTRTMENRETGWYHPVFPMVR